MVVLISALFMIFYIGGFITALYVMKFAKKYLISEWLYGVPRQNKGGDLNE